MSKLKFILPALMAGMIILSACAGAVTQEPTQGVETFVASTPTTVDMSTATEEMSTATVVSTEATATEMATAEASATALPTEASTMVPGIPATGGELEALTEMLRYRVVDNAGNELGQVRDYILNTCEAHVLYIVVDAETGPESVLIPYEAVSLNTNRPQDAAADELVVNFDAALLSSVPTIDLKTVDFNSPNWDVNIMNFWRQNIAISLTTACNVPTGSGTAVPTMVGTLIPGGTLVPSGTAPASTAPAVTETSEATEVSPTDVPATETPVASLNNYSSVALQATSTPPNTVVPGTVVAGTPVSGTPITTLTPSNRVNVFKVALASELIGANVVDVQNNMVAKVRDALVFKSTGSVRYFIVQLLAGNQQDANGNMVAVPPGAVNLFYGTEFLRNSVNASGTPAAATPDASSTAVMTPAAGTPVGGKTVDNNKSNRGKFDRPVLVLLVDLSVLQNAPAYSIVNGQMDQGTFDYWSKFVPMTRDALP